MLLWLISTLVLAQQGCPSQVLDVPVIPISGILPHSKDFGRLNLQHTSERRVWCTYICLTLSRSYYYPNLLESDCFLPLFYFITTVFLYRPSNPNTDLYFFISLHFYSCILKLDKFMPNLQNTWVLSNLKRSVKSSRRYTDLTLMTKCFKSNLPLDLCQAFRKRKTGK